MKSKRTDEKINRVKELREQGKTLMEIGFEFGVGESTVRLWLMSPEEYAKKKSEAVAWQRENKSLVNQRQREKVVNRSREQKDKVNTYARLRYAMSPKMRDLMRAASKRNRRTAQGAIAQRIRIANLSYADRMAPCHMAFMEAVTGLSKKNYTRRFGYEPGTEFDHIVPICAFDLTNPEHVVRCCYWKNLRVVPVKENQYKSDNGREIDVITLPWVGTKEALAAANLFITKVLKKLDRLRLKDNDPKGEAPENQT